MRKMDAGKDSEEVELEMVDGEKQAAMIELKASLDLFKVKLLRQRSKFNASLVAIKDWEAASMNEYKKMLRSQKDSYDAVCKAVVDQGFHGFQYAGANVMVTKVTFRCMVW
jgi:hypothetical protein